MCIHLSYGYIYVYICQWGCDQRVGSFDSHDKQGSILSKYIFASSSVFSNSLARNANRMQQIVLDNVARSC